MVGEGFEPITTDTIRPNSMSSVMNKEEKTGANCSGNDGETNRVLTLSNTVKTIQILVWVAGTMLHEGSGKDYTVNHKDTNSTITFLNPIYDDQTIDVVWFA